MSYFCSIIPIMHKIMKTIDLSLEDLETALLPEDREVALVGKVTLEDAAVINLHVFDVLDISKAVFGVEREEFIDGDPFGGSSYTEDVDVRQRVLCNCEAATLILPDDANDEDIVNIRWNKCVHKVVVGENCKLFSMENGNVYDKEWSDIVYEQSEVVYQTCDDCGKKCMIEGLHETVDGTMVCSACVEENYHECEECGGLYKGKKWPHICPRCQEDMNIYAAEKNAPEGWTPSQSDAPNADELPDYKLGERIRDFFLHKFEESFEFGEKLLEELPALKMDDGYRIYPLKFEGGIGSHYTLEAKNEEGKIRPVLAHLTAEYSIKGVWQAVLLTFTTTWMPLCWHAAYMERTYIFSNWDLESCNKDAFMKFKDEDIYPHVILNGNVATVTYCYWSQWRGLVKMTELFGLDDKGHLYHLQGDRNKEEVLYAYDCGVCF